MAEDDLFLRLAENMWSSLKQDQNPLPTAEVASAIGMVMGFFVGSVDDTEVGQQQWIDMLIAMCRATIKNNNGRPLAKTFRSQ